MTTSRSYPKEVEPVPGSVRGVSPGIGIGVGGGSGNFGVGISTGIGGGRADYSYVTYLDIIVLEGEKPEDDREAYVAFDVLERLNPAIVGVSRNGEAADEEGAAAQ